MTIHPLIVGLRGTRDYVQGSQILARTVELLPADDAVLTAAKFTRITDRGVNVALGDEATAADEIGTARFRVADAQQTVRFLDVPGDPAPRIDDVPPSTTDLTTPGDGSGRCTFAIDGDFESYLAAVIEFVKAVHAARADRVSDIWFTALTGATLPLAPIYPRSGILAVTPKIERMVGDRLQTLSVVETSVDGAGAAPAPFQISFSCVTE